MKTKKVSINKMLKDFDKELRNLLLTDLKVMRVAKTAFIKNEKLLMTA